MAAASVGPAGAQEITSEVVLNVARVGPGNVAREGSWTGLRVEVTDQGLEPQREIVLRVRVPDPDGDETDYDRVVTSNAGTAQAFWLYLPIPTIESGVDAIDVLAYEAEESTDDTRFGFRAGRLLGRTQIPLSSRAIVPRYVGIMGVVGSARLGVDGYGEKVSAGWWLPLGHETARIASGLDVSDMPDRWQGLSAMDVLFWGSTRLEADPGLLSADKARAIRDWVQRGGHLVIVLPSVGQEWFSDVGNPLAEILPRVRQPQLHEGVDLETYRPLLTSSRQTPLPKNGTVRTFEPAPDAEPQDAIPILNNADGQCVVMRRLYGCGAVTLVGIDLNLSGLRANGLPEPEVFWHRVLGRRGVLVSEEEAAAKDLVRYKSRLSNRSVVPLDIDLEDQIAMRGTAAMGVALGFVVFLLYWLAAGPVGFMLLDRAGLRRHAWVAFVGCVGVFTAVAWAAATAARPNVAKVRHITMLSGVYGQPVQRARSWMAMLVPFYGLARVSIEDAGDGPGPNLLAPLTTSAGLKMGGFPDNRSYRVETRRPDELIFPARSTVKEIQAEWAGASGWSLPEPVGQPGDLEAPRLRLVGIDEFDRNGMRIDHEVEGELVHRLPGPLEDVVVMVNTGQVSVVEGVPLGSRLSANVLVYELADPWLPDTRLDLAQVTRRASGQGLSNRSAAFQYLEELLSGERPGPAGQLRADPRRLGSRLKALALFPQLEPPSFGDDAVGVGDRLARREHTHGYDLGMWFTQPCVMVLGRVEQSGAEARSVVPVRLQGEALPCEGVTFVMWVYPLEPNPPAVRRAAASE